MGCNTVMEITAIAVAAGMCILSYLCGSVMSALVVAKALRLPDPRAAGSGNPGATNMLRLHGRVPGALTLAGDVGKGVLPVLLARLVEAPEPAVMICALAAFCGHTHPLFHGFKGGKGVATFLGILWALHWNLGLVFSGCWLAIAALWHYSSAASIVASLLTVAATLVIMPQGLYAVAPMTVLLVWRHKKNISLLLSGREKRIGS